MFIARGPKSSGSLNKHIDIPIKSADKIDYTSTNVVTGVAGVDPKLKSHASLMVIGWIGFCSIAIIFARFMKPVWPNSLLLGEKVWFTFHRSLQILNVLCFVTAFILIFVYVGGFVTYNSSTDLVFIHAVCGIIAVILGLTNPIMAIFRPHPGEPKRHVFNWAHWAVGNSAFILAIACIFIGMDLSALDLPQYTTWVFVGWVCFHVLIELFLEVTKCVAKND
ncbi:putative ferric-chelate reductase 1, partial [Saccoglossus kowalevskii]